MEILCPLIGEVRRAVLEEPLDSYLVPGAVVSGDGDVASATAKPATSSAPSTVFTHT